MDVSSIIFAVVTAFFTIRGYCNGLWRSLTRLAGLIGAYTAAFYYSQEATAWTKQYTPLDGVAAYMAGSIALFFAALIAIRCALWLLGKLLLPQRRSALAAPSRLGGAIIGAATGAVLGLLLVYLLGVYQAAQHPSDTPPAPDNTIETNARQLVSKTAGKLLAWSGQDDQTVRVAESLAAHPVASLDRVRRISHNPDLQQLLENPRAQRLMRQGNIDELMQIPAFKNMMQDDDLQHLLQDAGMAINSRASARDTAEKFAQGWQQYHRKKDDPRVQAILQDPEFKRQLNSDNKLPLLLNPKVNQLATLIFNTPSIAENLDEYTIKDAASSTDEPDTSGTTIYRHRDEDGGTRYSDRPQRP
jgi:uncharacterized membrane protein required for colicin V production